MSHLPCTKVYLAVCARIRDWVAAWVNVLQLNLYTCNDQLLHSDPLSRIPTARSSWRPAPSTPTGPPLIPFNLSPNPFIVSHLDRSHSLATHRWLRDCASRCIVGNHFDQARGHSQRVSVFPLPASGLIKGVIGINPKRVKGNCSVQTYTVITIIDKKTASQLQFHHTYSDKTGIKLDAPPLFLLKTPALIAHWVIRMILEHTTFELSSLISQK